MNSERAMNAYWDVYSDRNGYGSGYSVYDPDARSLQRPPHGVGCCEVPVDCVHDSVDASILLRQGRLSLYNRVQSRRAGRDVQRLRHLPSQYCSVAKAPGGLDKGAPRDI